MVFLDTVIDYVIDALPASPVVKGLIKSGKKLLGATVDKVLSWFW